MEINSTIASSPQYPEVGDIGMLTLYFTEAQISRSIKMACKLVQLYPNAVGVNVCFSDLPKNEQKIIMKMLDAQIDCITE